MLVWASAVICYSGSVPAKRIGLINIAIDDAKVFLKGFYSGNAEK
jgi:hypothetical protein